LQSYFWWLKRKTILSLNTHFFTNSIGSKNELVNSYKRLAEKISVLPLQIRPSKLKYAKRLDREFCIVIVGRLHPSKGHKDLLQQFSKCLFNFPNLILKIVGDGHLKSELKKVVKRLKIEDSVIFMGFIPNDSVDIIYRSALASISSSMQEAYGLNNIEALREGTPLICTKTAGSDDILVEGTNGECLDVKKPKSLSDSLHKILTKWDFYSKNSLSTFEQNYSLKNIGSHYDKIKHLI